MTFCNHCGKPVPDNAAFCPGCGSRLTPAAPNGAYNSNAQQQPRVQVPQVQTPPTQQYNAPPAPDFTKPQALPMNYYKFAIWVQLFLGALVYAVQGLGLLFGFWYEAVSGINAQWFYLFFPAMHIVDILFGLLYLAMAVGAVYTRQQMAHFKKNGPDLYYLFLIAGMVLSFLYAVLQGIICSTGAAFPVRSARWSAAALCWCCAAFTLKSAAACSATEPELPGDQKQPHRKVRLLFVCAEKRVSIDFSAKVWYCWLVILNCTFV